MSTSQITKQISETSPRRMTRFVGVYYLLTLLTGTFVLFSHGRPALAIDVALTFFYLALTVVFYALSKQIKSREEH
jgi:hypothetical protein